MVGLGAACASQQSSSDAPASTAATSTSASTTVAATDAATTAAATTDLATTASATTDPATSDPSAETTAAVSTTTTIADTPLRDGATRMHFEVGPIDVKPGQNNIDYTRGIPQPDVDGWIVRMKPDIRFADGTVPPVDVIHLHHGVWLNSSRPDSTAPLPERIMAAGEEKTITNFPAPYAYKYVHTDKWILNFMLHNLTADDKQLWITYDLDFIPADSPAAAGIVQARPIWMDVENGKAYPVFDVLKGSGANGTYTFPDDATTPYPATPLNQWVVDRDGVLIATAGHLHPGGLHTDLYDTRAGEKSHLFESSANYYEPAGAVSWDVAMTATTPDWAVAVKAGDTLSVSATYDSARASWYESMGIMVVWMADAPAAGDPLAGTDPFTTPVDKPGMLTHGHLKENDNHGGQPTDYYADLTQAPSLPVTDEVKIEDFGYGAGDMSFARGVPTVKPGGTITFDNIDAPLANGIWHTITSCKAPCDATTGIAFPLADGDVIFDSGELGLGGPPTANRVTWSIPTDLPEGTYTYFCRIHPIMRGAFRVSSETITP